MSYDTAQDVIDAWNRGDLSIENANKIEDLDGWTIQAKFLTEEGWVILTYDLAEDLCYRPDGESDSGLDQFNIEDE